MALPRRRRQRASPRTNPTGLSCFYYCIGALFLVHQAHRYGRNSAPGHWGRGAGVGAAAEDVENLDEDPTAPATPTRSAIVVRSTVLGIATRVPLIGICRDDEHLHEAKHMWGRDALVMVIDSERHDGGTVGDRVTRVN